MLREPLYREGLVSGYERQENFVSFSRTPSKKNKVKRCGDTSGSPSRVVTKSTHM